MKMAHLFSDTHRLGASRPKPIGADGRSTSQRIGFTSQAFAHGKEIVTDWGFLLIRRVPAPTICRCRCTAIRYTLS
jgi:hypothetical protein